MHNKQDIKESYKRYDKLVIGDKINGKTVVKIVIERPSKIGLEDAQPIKIIVFDDGTEVALFDGFLSFSEPLNNTEDKNRKSKKIK